VLPITLVLGLKIINPELPFFIVTNFLDSGKNDYVIGDF